MLYAKGGLRLKKKSPVILTYEQKEEVRQRALAGEDRKVLAKEFNLAIATIHNYAKYGIGKCRYRISVADELKRLQAKRTVFETFKTQIHVGDCIRVKEGRTTKIISVLGITDSNIFGKNENGIKESFAWNSVFCGAIRIERGLK